MSNVNWEHVARVNLHPLQVVILDLFGEQPRRTLSATALKLGTGHQLNFCDYHLKALASKGILKEAERRRGLGRRGGTEVFYRLAKAARA